MDVKIGQRGQVVIPVEVRRRQGIEPGDLLHLEVDERGRLILEPLDKDPVRRLREAGAGLFTDVDPVEEQRRLRTEWER